MTQVRGGIVVGPAHSAGGVPFILADTKKPIEEEGFEINIPVEITNSDAIYTFKGKNIEVLNKILNLAGLSITDKVNTVKAGDIVICVRSAWDDTKRTFTGTIEEILHQINTSGGCKPIINSQFKINNEKLNRNGGKTSNIQQPTSNFRKKDMEAINPNSDRWKKKKASIEQLSNNIHRLRMNITRDIQSDDERTALTALVVAVMDRTAERIGNDDSADNGHFGVTGFRKNHISVVGNKVHLDYVGKSGTKHEKSFSDERIAKALKHAIKNAPGKFIFETSDDFRIKSDKVNRYLEPFNISAKDLRGYNANKWIIENLKSNSQNLTSKERKKIFNKAVKETALRVGHGYGTLKKHYMIPELPIQYIQHGNIIDMKNLGYYEDGSKIKSSQSKIEIMKTESTKMESDMQKDSTEYLIDQYLKPLIDKVRKKAFVPEAQSKITDADVLGIIISKFNRWDIDRIKETCSSAFEDANYGDVVKEIEKLYGGGKLPNTLGSKYLNRWKKGNPEYLIEYDNGFSITNDHNKALMHAKLEGDATVIHIPTKTIEFIGESKKLQEGGPSDESEQQENTIEEAPSENCICFWDHCQKNNPELIEKIIADGTEPHEEELIQEENEWNSNAES